MPDFGDIEGLPPVTLDPAPDLASLPWPWDEPVPMPPGAAFIPGAVDVAAAPVIPDAAPDGALVPAAAAPIAATEPPPAMQPGLGIPQAALDALVQPAPASPLPAAAPAIAPPGAPVVAAPAVEQPLTPTAGVAAPVEPGMADLAPLGEPGLPPAPDPFAPPAFLPMPIEPVTGQLEPAGMPPESTLAGLAGAPLTPEQRYAVTAAEYQRDPGKLLDRLLQPGEPDAETQRYLTEFAMRDRPGFEVLKAKVGDAKLKHEAAERARVEDENWKRQQANIQDRDKAIADGKVRAAELDAKATEMANTKIGYHPTTFQRIAGIIAAVVGGLYQGRTGSARNPGLDALNDVINRDLEEQRANLANQRDVLNTRRTALAEHYRQTGDMFEANEFSRLAALKHAQEAIAQERLNYAADGTRGIALADLYAGTTALVEQSRRAIEDKGFEKSLKLQNAKREQQVAEETARNNRAQLGLGYARIDEDRAQRQEARDARADAKEVARADKLDKQVLERAIGGEATPVLDAQGNVIGSKTGYITKADGSVWIPNGTEAQISDLQKQHAAATALVQTLDAIRRVGPEWLLDTKNTDKVQRLKQLMGDARLQAIAAKNLGVPTGHDIELAENFIGTTDPTRWKDSVAGLMQGRDSLVRDHNAMLRTHGLDKKWDPPDTSSPAKPLESVDDKALKMVLGDPEAVAHQSFNPDGSIRPPHHSDWEAFPEQKTAYRGDHPRADYRGHGILLQKQQLDAWAKLARDASAPGHDEARVRLTDASGAATAEVRDYASALVFALMNEDIGRVPSAAEPEGR